VTRLADNEIVDTNGAGDMFAGGFMGAIVAGKSIDEAVEVGHKLGAMCVKTVSFCPCDRWLCALTCMRNVDWPAAPVPQSQRFLINVF
jgi:fructose-1-phosphate kinase PfkB-like protein